MGAWIETHELERLRDDLRVALYMGAWIETNLPLDYFLGVLRRTLYGCVD